MTGEKKAYRILFMRNGEPYTMVVHWTYPENHITAGKRDGYIANDIGTGWVPWHAITSIEEGS